MGYSGSITDSNAFRGTAPCIYYIQTLATDEYLTGIAISGGSVYNPSDNDMNFGLNYCGPNNSPSYELMPVKNVVGKGSDLMIGNYSKSDTRTDLQGKQIGLYRTGTLQAFTRYNPTTYWSINTAYSAYTITIASATGGTVTISSNSRKRGETATLTISPNAKYRLKSITASAGTITGTGNSRTFTMSTPAQNVTITPVFELHTLTWSNPTLTVSQNEEILTFTKGGTCTDSWGETITYKLYRIVPTGIDDITEEQDLATFVGNTATVTLEESDINVEYTYKVVAITSLTAYGGSVVYTAYPIPKTIGYFNGSDFIECIPYYYTGNEWKEVRIYYYTGTVWQLCSLS